jgi:hypothetical protein
MSLFQFKFDLAKKQPSLEELDGIAEQEDCPKGSKATKTSFQNQAVFISNLSKKSKVTLYYAKVSESQTKVMENSQNYKLFTVLDNDDLEKIT